MFHTKMIDPSALIQNTRSMQERVTFPGKVHLITTDQELDAVRAALSAVKEFGFDTETRPSFKKGQVFKVALLQLATETDAFIVRLHRITNFEILKNIFENAEVVKTGVAINHDLKQLKDIFSFTPKNFIELQTLAKTKGLQNFGLRGMAQEILDVTITKGPKLTNWEAPTLAPNQLMYAATDAWIGLVLFHKLQSLPLPTINKVKE